MASSLALKRLVSSNLLPKSLFAPIRPIASIRSDASRYFNTNAVRNYDDDAVDVERRIDVDRSPGRSPYSGRGSRDDFLSGSRLLVRCHLFQAFLVFVSLIRKFRNSAQFCSLYTLFRS